MKTQNEMFEQAIEHWRINKGIGTALIPFPLNDKFMVLGVLQKMYVRAPTCKVTIITSSFADRMDLIEFITHQKDSNENNAEFKKLIDNKFIKVITNNFIERNYPAFPSDLCIVYNIESTSNSILCFLNWCKFKLVVLNKLLNSQDMVAIYRIAPMLDDFKQAEIEQLRLSSPVEETQISITIDEDTEDFRLLKRYNEYIAASISIFGSFDIIQKANTGDANLNISSNQICLQIATENGWNEFLDMSVEFNVKLDELYNPSNLKERSVTTFEYIRKRSHLLTDYEGKLEKIKDIIDENKDKKFLIINKRGEFANKVTQYLNIIAEKTICLNYHDKVESIPATDEKGNPILYKSGAKKGKQKMIGAKAQKSLALDLFNQGNINVLSTNNLPDKSLSATIDGIILTSPMCENISSYIYRLSNLLFSNNRINLYCLYCRNTIEEKILENKDRSINHNVKNTFQDEDFSNFACVD